MKTDYKEWIKEDTKKLTIPELYAKMGMIKIIEWSFKKQGILLCEGMTIGDFNDLINDLAKEVAEDIHN